MPYDKIFSNGVFLYKNYFYKIIKVIPISYDLKSGLEKDAILNSYKVFLKTYNFDSQILIQSKKEDLSKHISILKENETKYDDSNLKDIFNNYYNYISNLNNKNKSASKNFYFILKTKYDISKQDFDNKEIIATNRLNEMFLKLKEALSRCGNTILELDTKDEVEKLFFSFYNLSLSL